MFLAESAIFVGLRWKRGVPVLNVARIECLREAAGYVCFGSGNRIDGADLAGVSRSSRQSGRIFERRSGKRSFPSVRVLRQRLLEEKVGLQPVRGRLGDYAEKRIFRLLVPGGLPLPRLVES